MAVTVIEALATGRPPLVERALAWFEGRPLDGQSSAWTQAEMSLAALTSSPDVEPLFPYLLDTFGRTSRLDVLRDNTLKANRRARKNLGSFYTPADIAEFMVSTINDRGADQVTWYDPACGSGVFLLAVLHASPTSTSTPDAHAMFATRRLLGTDISPQACDFAAFVLFQQLATSCPDTPASVWIALRRNLVAADALAGSLRASDGSALTRLFGPVERPLRLVCNPPYTSATTERDDDIAATAPGNSTGSLHVPSIKSLYLPFVELAWRLAGGQEDASVLVVPLAFAANRTVDHRRCRAALVAGGGNWTMLFFDRQPHALFGEDAKTRTAILVRRPGPTPAVLRTSGLLKWTSRQRATIFSEERATALGSLAIPRLIPKLGTPLEVALYVELTRYRMRRAARPVIEKAAANEIVGASLSEDVFVGGTAYNFLNIFRNYPDRLSWRGTLSASGIHALRCGNSKEADALTAILASRVAFWLWHVECDGFHVPAWFLQELPLIDIDYGEATFARLAELGCAIWGGAQRDILTSVNRDKITFAFRPTYVATERTVVDRLILEAVGFGADAVAALATFEKRVVSIDGGRRIAPSVAGVATLHVERP